MSLSTHFKSETYYDKFRPRPEFIDWPNSRFRKCWFEFLNEDREACVLDPIISIERGTTSLILSGKPVKSLVRFHWVYIQFLSPEGSVIRIWRLKSSDDNLIEIGDDIADVKWTFNWTVIQ